MQQNNMTVKQNLGFYSVANAKCVDKSALMISFYTRCFHTQTATQQLSFPKKD